MEASSVSKASSEPEPVRFVDISDVDQVIVSLTKTSAEPVRVGEIGVGREKAVAVQAVTKAKWVKEIVTKEEVDALVSTSVCNRPFPTLSEELLSAVDDLELRESIRQTMISGAELYRSSCQFRLRRLEYMRKQVHEKGYAERYVLVDATDDDDVPVGKVALPSHWIQDTSVLGDVTHSAN